MSELQKLERAADVLGSEGLSEFTYDGLAADRDLLERAALAIREACDLSYSDALQQLKDWGTSGAAAAAATLQRTPTLREVLDGMIIPAREAIRQAGQGQPRSESQDLSRAGFAIQAENLSIYTYDELLEDNSLLDRAGRAISTACGCSYLTALERLDHWVSLAEQGEESSPLHLGEIFRRVEAQTSREAKQLAREEERRLDAPPRVRGLHESSVDPNADARFWRDEPPAMDGERPKLARADAEEEPDEPGPREIRGALVKLPRIDGKP